MKQFQTVTDEDSITVDEHQYNMGKMLSNAKDEDFDIFKDGGYMRLLRDEYLKRVQETAEKPQAPPKPTNLEVYKQGVNKDKLTQSQLNIAELWRQQGDDIIKAVNIKSEDQDRETHQNLYNIGHRLACLKSHELNVFKDLR